VLIDRDAETVTFELEPVAAGDGHFSFVSVDYQTNAELDAAFADVIEPVLRAFGFDPLSPGPVPVAASPNVRSWDGRTLVERPAAKANDQLVIRWSDGNRWSAEWRQRRRGPMVERYATATHASPARYLSGDYVVPRGDHAAVAVENVALTYLLLQPGHVRVSGQLLLRHCPQVIEPVPITVTIDVPRSNAKVTVSSTDGRFEAILPIPSGAPSELRLAFGVDVVLTDPQQPLAATCTIPTAFRDAELSVDGTRFVARLLEREIPGRIRFGRFGYCPADLRIELTMRARTREKVIATAELYDARTAEYVLHFFEDSDPWSLRDSAPGTLAIGVGGQEEMAGALDIVPRQVEGWWITPEGRWQPYFELRSTFFDVSVVERLTGPEPSSATFAVTDGEPARGGGRRLDPADAPEVMLTHARLHDGTLLPIADGSFEPLYIEDPRALFDRRPLRFRRRNGEALHPIVMVTRTSAERVRAATLKEQLASGNCSVLQFDGGSQQAIVCLNLRGRTIGAPILQPAVLRDSTSPFVLSFRGILSTVTLEPLRASRSAEGSVLRLETPLRIDGDCGRQAGPFMPLRVMSGSDSASVWIWLPPDPPLRAERAGDHLLHDRIGYIYRKNGQSYWARYREDDDGAELLFHTFDRLVFSTAGGDASFHGWYLPNGSSTFPAAPPFSYYAFDFSESAPRRGRVLLDAGGSVPETELASFDEADRDGLRRFIEGIVAEGRPRGDVPLPSGRSYSVELRQSDERQQLVAVIQPLLDSHEVSFHVLQ
jgi:hypothetical protein